MAELPGIFEHYREQAESDNPRLTKSRGGTGFGEFAVDVITAVVTGSGRVEMVNVPNEGTLPALPPRRVAEVPCRLDRSGATPLNEGELPVEVLGLIEALGEYQSLAAEVGWNWDAANREAAVRALASNPLMWRLDVGRIAAMYDEMATAHAAWLR
jgi:6-phospho-beta-glucosidase